MGSHFADIFVAFFEAFGDSRALCDLQDGRNQWGQFDSDQRGIWKPKSWIGLLDFALSVRFFSHPHPSSFIYGAECGIGLYVMLD